MATMSIRISDKDKEQADILFKNLGVTINSAVNIFIKQCVREQRIPFMVSMTNPEPSKELLSALEEGEQILKDIKSGKRKGYNNVYEMFKELDEDIENGRV